MSHPCRCSTPSPTPKPHAVGEWQGLPITPPILNLKGSQSHELAQCACGCQEYTPGLSRTLQGDSELDIPVLPLELVYEDDDGPSDDHEYVSIKATEFAEMVSDLRACTCHDDH